MDLHAAYDLPPRPAQRYLRDTHGLSCSDEWLRQRARAGDIEHLRLPQGRLLFSRAGLDAYIQRIRVKAEAS
jgi:hypothetical protein